jgi:hypothetical protein
MMPIRFTNKETKEFIEWTDRGVNGSDSVMQKIEYLVTSGKKVKAHRYDFEDYMANVSPNDYDATVATIRAGLSEAAPWSSSIVISPIKSDPDFKAPKSPRTQVGSNPKNNRWNN